MRIFFLFSFLLSIAFAEENVVILGGGVSALSSAIYLARAGYRPLVITGKMPGGLLTQSHSVQNWPGEMEIAGWDLMQKMQAQAKKAGARLIEAEVTSISLQSRPFKIVLDGGQKEVIAKTCLIAMGTTPLYLGVEGEKEYWGKGVSNCAICDGSLYQGEKVAVIGGGDAAVLEALYLSNIAEEVFVFVRKKTLKAIEKERVKELLAKSNVKIFYQAEVAKIEGNLKGVQSLCLKSGKKVGVKGVFLAIGSKPNSLIFQNQLKLDPAGYIQVKETLETSVSGVYAVGDIIDPVYKQAVTAAGDGAKAALQLQKALSSMSKNESK